MPPVSAHSQHPPPAPKVAGYEPVPGYVLIGPLGRGGFGEVWKCEAPGGLLKAVKFVAGADDALASDDIRLLREYEAFQQVKAIRHPFLLTLERVELVGNELVMIMELADRQLADRFAECREQNMPGIPREELIAYLKEAAEALDVIGDQYGLQHLDVKPSNLFVTAGHVKVGDYGLVSKLDSGSGRSRGLTPRYAAPEVLRGEVHTRSDQYSLALVYMELLNGSYPYTGRSAQALLLQHATAVPDLSSLPERERPVIERALAKNPEERFPSCRAFIGTLAAARANSILKTPGTAIPTLGPKPRPEGETPAPRLTTPTSTPAPTAAPLLAAPTRGPAEPTRPDVLATPAPRAAGPSPLVPSAFTPLTPAPPPVLPPGLTPITRVNPVVPVVAVARLKGQSVPHPGEIPSEISHVVVEAARAETPEPPGLNAVTRTDEGGWACRFLTTMDPRVAQVRLDLLWEQGGVAMDTRDPGRVVFRQVAPVAESGSYGWFKKKPPPPPESGLEVVVVLPQPGLATGEVLVTGHFYGKPPDDFIPKGQAAIAKLIEGVRKELGNVPERRRHPRYPTSFALSIFPLHSDGRVLPPISGRCKNVSASGLALFCPEPPPTKYLYVSFDDVPEVADKAVLVQVLRAEEQNNEVFLCGRYKSLGAGQPKT